MARILAIFGRIRSSRRNLSFQNFRMIEKLSNRLIRSVDRSIDRIDRAPLNVFGDDNNVKDNDEPDDDNDEDGNFLNETTLR